MVVPCAECWCAAFEGQFIIAPTGLFEFLASVFVALTFCQLGLHHAVQ
jgi:hypothetical protein